MAASGPGNIVQTGEGSGGFSVPGPHFSDNAPCLNGLKKTSQVHVGTAQFAPGRGVSGFDRNLFSEVLDAGFECRHIGTVGDRRRACVAPPRVIPSGGACDGANDNDGGGNQDQACSVHGVFSDTI